MQFRNRFRTRISCSPLLQALAVLFLAGWPAQADMREPLPDPADYGDEWFDNQVPEATMGIAKARGMSPRTDDPEWESVITGKREVAVHDREFNGGSTSPVALARRILELMEVDSRDGLRDLAIDRYEFGTLFWPEFPASRPITNWKPDEAWFFHAGKVESGISEGLDYRGVKLILDRVTCEGGHAPYTNFDLYHGIRIYAHNEKTGESVKLDFVKTFACRLGKWKVFIYDD
ncbi:MAG: hypothetical protein KJ970_16885 [Candidatus Eisenbacteria bacterium]|uniref:Uncharacterized protein n=1 Tax=Eiseniibacteriota bacterium TaxID=2212470 RepID=A0A948S0I1_UNCEI|nr:hypothetical protein [Candidatus Eisenbacteria bacterium]MBU1950909.1 hypothetical protein [Candidatus Eisenbacteria bacterium]MBU2692592.1 hypothetical protein [Candidatus Eisenbacteria bacterium]